jgi:hypothetical protein
VREDILKKWCKVKTLYQRMNLGDLLNCVLSLEKRLTLLTKVMSVAGFLLTFPTSPERGFSEMNLMKEQA